MSENTGKLTTANSDFTGVVVDGLITRIVGKDSVYIKGGATINTSSWLFLYNNSDSSIQNNPNAPFLKLQYQQLIQLLILMRYVEILII